MKIFQHNKCHLQDICDKLTQLYTLSSVQLIFVFIIGVRPGPL